MSLPPLRLLNSISVNGALYGIQSPVPHHRVFLADRNMSEMKMFKICGILVSLCFPCIHCIRLLSMSPLAGTTMTEAWVTLATSDGYAVGALVLGRSLKIQQTTKKLHCMITTGVLQQLRYTVSQQSFTLPT